MSKESSKIVDKIEKIYEIVVQLDKRLLKTETMLEWQTHAIYSLFGILGVVVAANLFLGVHAK